MENISQDVGTKVDLSAVVIDTTSTDDQQQNMAEGEGEQSLLTRSQRQTLEPHDYKFTEQLREFEPILVSCRFTRSEYNPWKLINVKQMVTSTCSLDEDDTSFDEQSLFSTTESIILGSTQMIDNLLQGTILHVETSKSFGSPLSTLIKSIGLEIMSYKGSPDDKIALESSALEILKKLSKYSWKAKAVLVFAAFALEYEESDKLAKTVAILEMQKRRRDEVVELNNLMKVTLLVIEYMFKHVSALAIGMEDMPLNVHWSIITILACAAQLNLLTSDENNLVSYILLNYVREMKKILNGLKTQHRSFGKQIGGLRAYLWMIPKKERVYI